MRHARSHGCFRSVFARRGRIRDADRTAPVHGRFDDVDHVRALQRGASSGHRSPARLPAQPGRRCHAHAGKGSVPALADDGRRGRGVRAALAPPRRSRAPPDDHTRAGGPVAGVGAAQHPDEPDRAFPAANASPSGRRASGAPPLDGRVGAGGDRRRRRAVVGGALARTADAGAARPVAPAGEPRHRSGARGRARAGGHRGAKAPAPAPARAHRTSPAARPPAKPPAVAPPPSAAARGEDSLVRSLRSKALAAMSRALGAGATPADIAPGDSVFKGAESLAARGQSSDAMVQLATAASLWSEAERVARSRPRDTVRVPPAKPAPAAPPAVAPPHDARVDIQKVIDDYARALESRDVEQVRHAYPGLTPAQQQSWQGFFGSVRNFKVGLTVTAVRFMGLAAEAIVGGVYEYDNANTGRAEHRPATFRALLAVDSTGWHITTIR